MTVRAKLILLGAGGHAKVVAELAMAGGWQVTGFLDPGRRVGERVLGLPILGSGTDLGEDRQWLEEHDLFPAIGHGDARWREFVRLVGAGARVPALIHPAATVSPSVVIAAGSVVMAGAVVQADCGIGPAAIINTGARVDHDCQIGAGVMIAPGAILCGGVHVGDHAFIAAGAVLVPGVRVGASAFVGAGMLIAESVADGTRMVPPRRAPLFPTGS